MRHLYRHCYRHPSPCHRGPYPCRGLGCDRANHGDRDCRAVGRDCENAIVGRYDGHVSGIAIDDEDHECQF